MILFITRRIEEMPIRQKSRRRLEAVLLSPVNKNGNTGKEETENAGINKP